MKTKAGTELPLISLKGKDYLEVKWRLVWFREERGDWSIETEFKDLSETHALAKATVRDQTGRVIATGHKREDKTHFPDFAEKAETGAIGRALALCGYGTQFSPEIEEGERIVDAPVARSPQAANVIDINAPGAYSMKFGKYQGQRLEDIGDVHALNSYLQWLRNSDKQSDLGLEAIKMIDAYLKTREFPRVAK